MCNSKLTISVLILICSVHGHYIRPNQVGLSLQCDQLGSKICLNGGVCADWGAMINVQGFYETCICQHGFYGPHCEYIDFAVFEVREQNPRIKRQRIVETKDTETKEFELSF